MRASHLRRAKVMAPRGKPTLLMFGHDQRRCLGVVVAVVVVVRRETWVSRHGPPSTISNKLQFCVDSSLSFSTVDQVCSDALYTPDLAPFCSPSPLAPASVIPLVGGNHLICFLFFYYIYSRCIVSTD